eukprot:5641099-Prorocentrum_lima.AAC.1
MANAAEAPITHEARALALYANATLRSPYLPTIYTSATDEGQQKPWGLQTADVALYDLPLLTRVEPFAATFTMSARVRTSQIERGRRPIGIVADKNGFPNRCREPLAQTT